jgi:HSP20 family protein
MWSEALSMLDRAERLHRQFFSHSQASWEPPVDIIESSETLRMHIALPGVAPDAITVSVDPAGVTVSALRAFPCREEGSHIHRIEIPYGRFERHIGLPLGDPYARLELAEKNLADGVLTLTFRRKEGA